MLYLFKLNTVPRSLKDVHKMKYFSVKMIKQLVCSMSAQSAVKLIVETNPELEVTELDGGEYYSFSRNGKMLLGIEPFWRLRLENGDCACAVSIFSPDSERPFDEEFQQAVKSGKHIPVIPPKMEEVTKKYPEIAAAMHALSHVVYKTYDTSPD